MLIASGYQRSPLFGPMMLRAVCALSQTSENNKKNREMISGNGTLMPAVCQCILMAFRLGPKRDMIRH